MSQADDQQKPGTPDAEPPSDQLPSGENFNSDKPTPTPLEQVKEQQAMQQQSQQVNDLEVESRDEVPGHSKPSDKRHHPQRQMYGSGTNES